MNDTTNPARRLRHGDRPTAPLRWNDRWTLLLTGPHHGLIGPLGSTWPDQSTEYERVDVCALPTGARIFPDRDPNKPAEEQGLFNKFIVMRTDGKDAPGEKHHSCAYFVLDLDHDRHAPAAMRAYASACSETHPALAADLVAKFGKPKLDDSEQYRLQMAAIGTASFGYWKEGDSIHPDYDTVPLRDVARLYAKYEELFKFRADVQQMVELLKNRTWRADQVRSKDAADLQGQIALLVGAQPATGENGLLPCPFCGGPVDVELTHSSRHEIYGMRDWWGVKCRNTINLGGTCAIEQVPSASKEAAIERWNTRAPAVLSAAPAAPEGWEISWDAFSPPDTIRLNSPKWGGCFLRPPEPDDIGLHALAYRLLRDMLEAAPKPDAVDAALHDAIVHGAGAFRVHGDGTTERVELTKEQHRHYAELAAFPPNLQRDALYHDYAVPPKEDPKP